MKAVSISTDGACIGNPGPGGWAYILRFADLKKEMFGSEPKTTITEWSSPQSSRR